MARRAAAWGIGQAEQHGEESGCMRNRAGRAAWGKLSRIGCFSISANSLTNTFKLYHLSSLIHRHPLLPAPPPPGSIHSILCMICLDFLHIKLIITNYHYWCFAINMLGFYLPSMIIYVRNWWCTQCYNTVWLWNKSYFIYYFLKVSILYSTNNLYKCKCHDTSIEYIYF